MSRAMFLVATTLTFACGPRQAGDRCADTKECAQGLVCMAEACVDGQKVTKDRAKRIESLVQRYMHENKGDCPPGGIDEFRSTASIADAWGKDFRVVCPGKNFVVDVISAGPDGKHDSADDIANVDAPADDAAPVE